MLRISGVTWAARTSVRGRLGYCDFTAAAVTVAAWVDYAVAVFQATAEVSW